MCIRDSALAGLEIFPPTARATARPRLHRRLPLSSAAALAWACAAHVVRAPAAPHAFVVGG
eukprot:2469158-Prymnesium_polylepis.1